MRFVGLNLTVPHKLLALEIVDVLAESARTWGAVNTIRFEGRRGDRWLPLGEFADEEPAEVRSHGFNTDADAIIRSLREDLGFEVRGARIVLLGAGGAGQGAAWRLASEGVRELHLVNRTIAKAQELAGRIQERFPQVSCPVGYPDGPADLLLNATSAGLKENDPLPFDAKQFSPRQARFAYDMIYRPAETRFLREARAAGLKTANGIGMLLYQGAAALELWTGRPAPLAEMRSALQQNIYGV
jgi:shikimate dehydrogenase